MAGLSINVTTSLGDVAIVGNGPASQASLQQLSQTLSQQLASIGHHA